MSNIDRPDVYELRPLLYPALPLDPGVNPTSPAALGRSLRCAEPYRTHLYLGSSDGQVFCFIQPALDRDGDSDKQMDPGQQPGPSSYARQEQPQEFRHVGTRSISAKPIERIVVMPALQIAAVLSESTLSFHELPAFLPVPQQVLPHVKGVAAVLLDDQEANDGRERGSGVDAEGLASLCIVRRKAIMLVKMSSDTWRVVKEVPLPGGATNARRFGDWLCISTTSEYNVVNLKAATLSPVGLPITQTGSAPSASCRPSIVAVPTGHGQCEFLITSHSDDVTLGVFISQEGEPTARLLEWPSHPRALSLDYPYLHALLRNDTIEVHNLASLESEQTIHLPPLLEPRSLSNATSSVELVEATAQLDMSLVAVHVAEKAGLQRTGERRQTWKAKALGERYTRSRVLMIGKNVVQSLCRTRILDSAIRAIQRGDVGRAETLAERAWGQRAAFDDQSLETLELEYVNQMIAVHCLRLLRFEDAGKYILRGGLDYRVVLSKFPSMSDGLLEGGESVDLFVRVVDGLEEIGNLDALPNDNLSLNYCPPLVIEFDPLLHKLCAALTNRIHRLLRYLVDAYRQDQQLLNDPHARRTLDTVFARMLIRQGDDAALSSFLEGPSSCEVGLIEQDLASVGCYAAKVRIRAQEQDWSSALEIQTKLLDGELIDTSFKGTTQDVANMLNECNDAELVHRYAIWLIQRDSTAGVKILTKGRTSGARSDRETLNELRSIDDNAATAFLEALALTRKHQDADAHRELVHSLMSKIKQALHDQREREVLQATTQEFVQGAYAESFAAHLALHASTSRAVVYRLKLMALLQASSVLDEELILSEVEQEPLLLYEKAILFGKRRNDAAALKLLAVNLRDANSAETYCSQDRKPLSILVLQSIDVPDLTVYTSFVARTLKKSGGPSTKGSQLALLKTLLHVYMEEGVGNEFQVATTHLLNTQAMHLSTQEILATVPAHWSVRTLETFLSRSLRREMHRVNEGQIQRAMALAQNLEVAETLWAKRRGLGGVIEDGSDGHEGGEEGGSVDDGVEGEDALGRALVEKVKAEEKRQRNADAPSQITVDIVQEKQ